MTFTKRSIGLQTVCVVGSVCLCIRRLLIRAQCNKVLCRKPQSFVGLQPARMLRGRPGHVNKLIRLGNGYRPIAHQRGLAKCD